MSNQRRGSSDVAVLREKIDRGLTKDKVRALDPAAAPLGTDDEAAGQPVSRERAHLAGVSDELDQDEILQDETALPLTTESSRTNLPIRPTAFVIWLAAVLAIAVILVAALLIAR